MTIAREMIGHDPSALGAIKRTIYSAITGEPQSVGSAIETEGLLEALFSPVTLPRLQAFLDIDADKRRDWFESCVTTDAG